VYKCTAGDTGSEILRASYSQLTTELDARIVAVNMFQRHALTLKELETIQSAKDRPVEAAEMLLNIILELPDAGYLCFLDVLKHTEQQHIYQRLVKDIYKGQWSNLFYIVNLTKIQTRVSKSIPLGWVISTDRAKSGWPERRTCRNSTFCFLEFCPLPTEYMCQVSSTSAHGSRSLRVLKMLTPHEWTDGPDI